MRTRCVYCGARLGARARLTCRAHRDLPALDPHYCRQVREPTTEHWVPAAIGEHVEQVLERIIDIRRAA